MNHHRINLLATIVIVWVFGMLALAVFLTWGL